MKNQTVPDVDPQDSDEQWFYSLTDHEKLLLWRKRMNFTQLEASEVMGVSHWIYSESERGNQNIKFNVPWVRRKALEKHERCLIYRLRAVKSQQQVADDLGVSKVWIGRMEKGYEPCNTLLDYWEC